MRIALAGMGFAQRIAAARNGIVAAVVFGTLPATPAGAGDASTLTLPLRAAVGLVRADERRPAASRTPTTLVSVAPGPRLTLLPSQLHIPDAYDEEIDVNLRPYVAPVDTDRVVSFDLFRRPQRGWMASIAYDEEDRGPFPGGGDFFSLTAEYRF